MPLLKHSTVDTYVGYLVTEFALLNPVDGTYIGVCLTNAAGLKYVVSVERYIEIFGNALRAIELQDLTKYKSRFHDTPNYGNLLTDFFGPRTLDLYADSYGGQTEIEIANTDMRSLMSYIQSGIKKVKQVFNKPDYQPYPEGTVVYRLNKNGTGEIDYKSGAGKIISKLNGYSETDGSYLYEVDFLSYGGDHVAHTKLIPTRDFFDKMVGGKDCYLSNFKSGNLFEINTPFLLRDGYLYNKGNSVILKFAKFETKFRKNDLVRESTDKAKEI